MVVAVDIDDTLCVDDYGPFENREPKADMVKLVQRLYEMGHQILIVTARPDRLRDLTIQWLAKYGILYHQLIMEKPRADVYIDDRAMRPDEAVEKLNEVLDEQLRLRKAEGGLSVRLAAMAAG